MDLIPVTKDGEYLEINPVAVPETLALGWVICDKQEPASPKRLAIAEIREALTEKGVAFDVSAKRADLLTLLEQAEAPQAEVAAVVAPAAAPVATDFVEAAAP